MIILTAAQAAKVRGVSPTHPWAAIEPAPLKDGTFMLDEACYLDPAHADVQDILRAGTIGTPDKSNTYNSRTGSEIGPELAAKLQADERAVRARMPEAKAVRVKEQKVAGVVDKIKRWFA